MVRMDLIGSVKKRRNVWLEFLHAVFNIAFVAAILGLVLWFPDSWFAAILVILAKWRTLAVRPRHWRANILASLPDLLLGVSITVLMWNVGIMVVDALPTQIALAVFYAIWLIFIKPQHRKQFVMIQAGLSQFVSITALFAIGYLLPVWTVVFLTFIISFASARQMFGLFEEKHKSFLASVWGLIVAQLAFVAWHWIVAYQVAPGLYIPAFAIIV